MDFVSQFAPDEQSLTSAKGLLSLSYWPSLGLNGEAIWGTSRGSRLYDVAVDLTTLKYRCNCPSRKQPCRHVLGLLMLLGQQPDLIPEGSPPESVQTWLERVRAKGAESGRKKERTTEVADPAAQEQRRERRFERIRSGSAALQVWMNDLVRNGLGGLEAQGAAPWEEQARRLVDAQAPGLANWVRRLGEMPGSSMQWPERLLAELGRLKLLLMAIDRFDQLPAPLRWDVRQLSGWPISAAELEEHGEQVHDEWMTLGQQETDEDRIRVQRTWMLGRTTERSALVLQFAPGNQSFPMQILPGETYAGTLLYSPGASPQRARCMEWAAQGSPAPFRLAGVDSIEGMLESYARQLSRQPWQTSTLCICNAVTLTRQAAGWAIRDAAGQSVPLYDQEPWRLLAQTGGGEFQLVGEWNGETLLPLGWMASDGYQVAG